MLVLSRKVGERIVVGENIVITIVATSSGGAKLGIEAPRNVSVHREEVYQRVRRGRQATTTTPLDSIDSICTIQ